MNNDKKYCPNPKCTNAIIEAEKGTKKVKCSKCKEAMCF